MALTKVKNSNIYDADLVTLADNDGSNLTGVLKTGDIGSTVQAFDANIATTSDITTAVSDLVDSAPGTLNTLNELAAALGDDENHASAMTTLISAKLSPDGDGSQLINLPPGGDTFSRIATGAVSASDPLVLNSDGTVSTVGMGTSLDYITSAVPASDQYRAIYYPPTGHLIVLAVSGSTLTCYLGTLSGTSITLDSGQTVSTNAGTSIQVAYNSTDQKVVAAWTDGYSSLNVLSLSVSGTTVSTGIATTTGNYSGIDIAYFLNQNAVVVLSGNAGGSAYGVTINTTASTPVLYVDTAAVSIQHYQTTSGRCFSYSPTILNAYSSAGVGGLVARRGQAGQSAYLVLINVQNNTSAPWGSAVTMGTYQQYPRASGYDPSSEYFIYVTMDQASSSNYELARQNASGWSNSWTDFSIGNYTGGFANDVPNDKLRYYYSDSSNMLYVEVGTTGATSFTVSSPITVYATLIGSPMTVTTAGNFITVGTSDGTLNTQRPPQTNLTSSNFIGFAKNSAVDGASLDVTSLGGITSGQSSLVSGTDYYLSGTGALTTNTGDRLIGRAISSTELVITEKML